MSDRKFRCNHCGTEIVVDDTIVSSGGTWMYCDEGVFLCEEDETSLEVLAYKAVTNRIHRADYYDYDPEYHMKALYIAGYKEATK